MTRRWVMLLSMLLTLSLLACVWPAVLARAAENGLQISNVDVSNPPHVVLEFTAPATVTGPALTANQVTLTANGAAVTGSLTAVPTAGLEVVLAIDTSGSMKGAALEAAKAAAQRFLQLLPVEVPVGVVAFADTPRLVSALTVDRALLDQSIGRLSAHGETALYDAMVLARSVFSGASADRQIVLLSDGGNTVGSASLNDALGVAGAIRTSVVELTSSEANPAGLQQLAGANRGTLSAATDPKSLTTLYETIANSLLHRYRLEFDSAATGDVIFTVTVTTAAGSVSTSATATVPTEGSVAPGTDPSTIPGSVASSVPAVVSTLPAAGGGGSHSASSSALSTDWWLLLGAGSFFAALLLCLLAFALRPKAPTGVNRLGAPARRPRPSAVGDRASGVGARLESLAESALARGNRRHRIAVALEVAAINLRPGEFAVLAALAGIVLALALSTIMTWIGFVVGLAGGPFLAWLFVSARADARRRKFDEQLPDGLHLIVTLLQSGYGLPQALDAVSNQVAEPTASEFRRVLLEVRIGRDPTDALAATAERMKSRDFGWVVSAININREVGGELAAILEAVAETVRERQRLARQVQTLTAEGRLSAWVLTVLPLLLVAVLAVINPGYFEPMKSSPGPLLIVIAVVLMVVGWVWMRRLIRAQM